MRISILSALRRLSRLWLTISQWPWPKISEWCVLGFLVLAILWRGGKSLDATWFLVGVSWLCTTVWWWKEKSNNGQCLPAEQAGGRGQNLFLWCCVILSTIWVVVSYRYSTTQNYGLDEVLRTGAFGFLFLWLIRIFTRKSDHTAHRSPLTAHLFRVVTFVTLLACIIGLFIYVLQPVNRFVGTFFDYRFHTDYWPNAWAEYLLLVWPICLLYMQKSLRWFETARHVTLRSEAQGAERLEGRLAGLLPMTQRFLNGQMYLHVSILGFIIGCLFLSYSRGAMVAFGGQLMLWLVLSYPFILSPTFWKTNVSQNGEKQPAIPWKIIATNAGIALCLALTIFFVANIFRSSSFDIEDPWKKVTFESAEGSSSVSERALFWRQAISLAWQRPFFGWGPYSFRFIQPHVQEGVLTTSDHPHNVFLKLAMEQGWIAAILFGLIVGFVLWRGWRIVVNSQWLGGSEQRSEERNEIILLLVSISGVLAHNFIDYNLQFVGIALPFWIILALLYSQVPLPALPGKAPPITSRTIRFVEITFVTALLLIALFEGGFLLTSSLGRHAEAKNEPERALFWYNTAQGEWFSRDLHISRIQLLLNKNALPEASIAISDYLNVNENDHRIWKIKGDFHLQRREFNEAFMSYERAYLYGKYNDLGPMLGIIDVYLKKQEWFTLKNRLPEFEGLLGEYVDAIERNIHFIALSRTAEDFLAIADRLEKAFPEEGPRYQVMGARVDRHASIERERFRARPLGRLW